MKISWSKFWIWILKHKLVSAIVIALIFYKTRVIWLWPISHFSRWEALRQSGYAKSDGTIFAVKFWSSLVLISHRKNLTKEQLTLDLTGLSEIYRENFVGIKELRGPHYVMLQEWFRLCPPPRQWQNVPRLPSEKWNLYLGIDAFAKPVFHRAPRRGHLYLAGATGAGKTTVARNIADFFEESSFRKVIVSTKAKDFSKYSGFFLYKESVSDELLAALREVEEEVERRRKWMFENNIYDIEKTPFLPIALIIDEAYFTLRTLKKTKENEKEAERQTFFQESISRHLRENRDAGVLVILCSQRATLDELEELKGFKSNVTVIAGRLESRGQSEALFHSPIAFINKNIQSGQGVMLIRNERGEVGFLKAPI